jgi:hypothetical protein
MSVVATATAREIGRPTNADAKSGMNWHGVAQQPQ